MKSKDSVLRWNLTNFKSTEKASLQFKKLNVLLGANSSGKSSIIQSMLAMGQYCSGESSISKFPFLGSLVSLGGFEDVCHKEYSNLNPYSKISLEAETADYVLQVVVGVDLPAYQCAWEEAAAAQVNVDLDFDHVQELNVKSKKQNFEIRLVRDLSQMHFLNGIGEAFPDEGHYGGYRERNLSDFPEPGYFLEFRTGEPGIEQMFQMTTPYFIGDVSGYKWSDLSAVQLDFSKARLLDQVLRWTLQRSTYNAPYIHLFNLMYLHSQIEKSDSTREFLEKEIKDARENTWKMWVEGKDYWSRANSRASSDGDIERAILNADKTFVGESDAAMLRAHEWQSLVSSALSEFDDDEILAFYVDHYFDSFRATSLRFADDPVLSVSTNIDRAINAFLESTQSEGHSVLKMANPIAEIGKAMTSFSEAISYLGPLRINPGERFSAHANLNSATPLGVRGENLAYLLLNYGHVQGVYVTPDSASEKCTLFAAINSWLRYFGMDSPITLERNGSLLDVKVGGKYLQNQGTGLSQLLPAIAQALTAGENRIILVEQPELHLHPDVQSKLGDFYFHLAESGTRVLLETHSEYFITRLRRLTAVDGYDPRICRIIFAEKSGNASKFKVANLSKNGQFSNWPSGFFEQVQQDLTAIIESKLSNP